MGKQEDRRKRNNTRECESANDKLTRARCGRCPERLYVDRNPGPFPDQTRQQETQDGDNRSRDNRRVLGHDFVSQAVS